MHTGALAVLFTVEPRLINSARGDWCTGRSGACLQVEAGLYCRGDAGRGGGEIREELVEGHLDDLLDVVREVGVLVEVLVGSLGAHVEQPHVLRYDDLLRGLAIEPRLLRVRARREVQPHDVLALLHA